MPTPAARCGSTAPHRAHWVYPTRWCAGNLEIVVAQDPDAAAQRAAFLAGHPIGSPERPAMIGGIPFVARTPDAVCEECGLASCGTFVPPHP